MSAVQYKPNCKTMISLSDKKDIHLMGEICPLHQWKVNLAGSYDQHVLFELHWNSVGGVAGLMTVLWNVVFE